MRSFTLVLVCLASTCLGGHAKHTLKQEHPSTALAMLLLESRPAVAYSPSAQGVRIPTSTRRHAMPVASAASRRQAVAGVLAAAAVSTLPIAANAEGYPKVKMVTSAGDMEFELYNDVAPKHVASFLNLTNTKYYDDGAFFRVVPGFVVQGGDPNSKVGYGEDGQLETGDRALQRQWGKGEPGYTVPAEFNERPHDFGVLSSARASDPDSGGSQFFICLGKLPTLDMQYTVFGKITKGEDVLKAIGSTPTSNFDHPLIRQGIKKVEVVTEQAPAKEAAAKQKPAKKR